VQIAMIAVNAQAMATRIAIWTRLRSWSEWWPDIAGQPFNGF
jgi:hypothetical protein